MIEDDTIKLLRQCDAGIKMGTSSIQEVLGRVKDPKFQHCLRNCGTKHRELAHQIQEMLDQYHDDGTRLNPVVQGMARMKTECKLAMHPSDSTIAQLMIDGCNMGTTSLSRYLNQYKAADEASKDMAKRLISLEDRLTLELRPFL